MLGIKINGEYLDLPADIGLEMQRNNPYLNDDIQGEFSLTLNIKYTDKNYRVLTYAGNFYKKNEKLLFDAEIYDNGTFRYGGVLVINQHTANMNRQSETSWSGFFTIGSSSFFQMIQDYRLQDVDYGGARNFRFTTFNINDGSGGFWQHIHAARTPNSFPYTFYPIVNYGWNTKYIVQWMNKLDDNNNFVTYDQNTSSLVGSNTVSITPAIYYSYILTRIFAQFGWKISGEILSDPGFIKLTMPSFNAITWARFRWHGGIFDPGYLNAHLWNISFDLADHVPQSVTVGEFLTNLKTRFGWYFYFDSFAKTAYLKPYKNLIGTTAKDWTGYVAAPYTAEYKDKSKTFSLVNNIDANDLYPVILKVDETTLLPPAFSPETFPDAQTSAEGAVIYSFLNNSYYINQINDAGDLFEWVFFSHNIGDYEPPGSDTVIESEISTMPIEVVQNREGFRALCPRCYQPGNFAYSPSGVVGWGMRALFYHGMVTDKNVDGSFSGTLPYPYASCHNLTIDNQQIGKWSIPYRHEYLAVNDGTYDTWWKTWLALLSIQDIRTFNFRLPLNELKNFKFDDSIVINNVFFIVMEFKEVLPYKGVTEFKMKRIY